VTGDRRGTEGGFVDRWVDAVSARPGWWVLGAVALAAVALIPAPRVRLDTRLDSLLPDDAPAVRALDELSERAVSSSPLYVVIEAPTPAQAWATSEAVAGKLAGWPDTRRAINRRDARYFEERRLLFVPADDLENFADDIEARVQWERCEAVPGCVNLVDEPPQPDPDRLREVVVALPEVAALRGVLGPDAVDRLFATEGDPKEDGTAGPGAGATAESASELPLGALCNPKGTVCAVEALLEGSPRDLDYAEGVLARADRLFAEVRRELELPPEVRIVTSGRYRNATLTKQHIETDLRNTSILSLTLVVLVLVAQFRGPRALVLLLVPLAVGAAWAVGVIALWHPKLNVISAFVMAILAGLGVDFGVHLLTHYGGQRARGAAPARAVRETLASLGSSMVIAATTTGCAFAALSAASFRGFSEMGMLAAVGILCALLAFLLVFPPLALWLDRVVPEKRSPIRPWPFLEGRSQIPRRLARPILAVGVVLGGLGLIVGSGFEFEYDFKKLQSNIRFGIRWSDAMHGTARSSVDLLADDPETLVTTAQALREEHPTLALGADERRQALLLTPQVFVPVGQDDRVEAVAYLREIVEDARRHAKGQTAEAIDAWEPYLDVDGPIVPDDLPGWAGDFFRERDGTYGTLGILYVRAQGSDAKQMEALANQMDRWRERFPGVRFASPVALIGEIVPELEGDAPVIVGLALAGLFLATVVVGRSVRRTALVMAPTFLGIALGLGGMVALGIKLNFYNMLILPLAFGIGVDGAIYRVWAEDEGRALGTNRPAEASTRAILGSTLTTVAAFGSLAVAQNPGLASLAHLALVAIPVTVFSNLVWLPALLRLRRPD